MMNQKIKKFIKKKNKTKLVCLTAYSKNISAILDKFCDLILVGDSLANVVYGMKNTHNITLEIMKNHARSVKLGVKKSLIVVLDFIGLSAKVGFMRKKFLIFLKTFFDKKLIIKLYIQLNQNFFLNF